MIRHLDAILQVVHKDAVSLTDVSGIDVCYLLDSLSNRIRMFSRIDLR